MDGNTQTVTIDIPVTAFVSCPKAGYKLTQVVKCPDCSAFAGVQDRFPGANAKPFHERFAVSCFGAPVQRPVSSVVL